MKINSRFSVAIHILSLIDQQGDNRMTSERIASSVNTNPVVIRRIMGLLSRADLVRTRPGVPGADLIRPLREITLLDVYRAVRSEEEGELFAVHGNPNPACPIGRNIQATLEDVLAASRKAMEDELARTTMETVVQDVLRRGAR